VARLRFGVSLGYWIGGNGTERQAAIAGAAERIGYESIWAAEIFGSDAPSVLGWLAARTRSIALGSAVFQLPGRTAAMTAMTAATLDQLCDGRFRLGLGTSGPQIAEGWHGQRFARPLARTRDYVSVVRMALARREVRFDGETLHLPLPDSDGKALKLGIGPRQTRIPIYLASIGPRNVELTGEIADGWLPFLFSPRPEHTGHLWSALRRGVARSGRSLRTFDTAPIVQLRIDDDLTAARDAMRPLIALYVGGMGSRRHNFHNELVRRYGFEEAAATVQEHYLAGRPDLAAAAVPTELIDAVSLAGPPALVRERLAAFADSGVTSLLVKPVGRTAEDQVDQLRKLAELA
jgi:F420-dependent oxidoreductase-like protein